VTDRGEMTDTQIASHIEGKRFARNLTFVSSLLAIGFVMEEEMLASLLGLPTPWVRQQLEDRSVKTFVSDLRRKHREAWSDV
jgi:hypothetical protein